MTTAEVVRKAYGLFQTGDIPGLTGLFSDKIEYHIKGEPHLPYAGVYKGKEAVMGFFQKLGETLDFTKFDLIELVCEGDKAMGVVDMAAKVRSTGKPVASLIMHRMHLQGGKIARFEDFPDTKLVYDALQG